MFYNTLSYVIILYHNLSYFIILYHTLSYIIILYHTLSYVIIRYHTLSYFIILYHTLSYVIIRYHTLLYFIILYHTLSYFIILYYTLSYFIMIYAISMPIPFQFPQFVLICHVAMFWSIKLYLLLIYSPIQPFIQLFIYLSIQTIFCVKLAMCLFLISTPCSTGFPISDVFQLECW